jgi:hypothetical protein
VEHQLLDGAALATRRLEAAVLAAPQAVALLDLASNCLVPKVGGRPASVLSFGAVVGSAPMTRHPQQVFGPAQFCHTR